MPGRLCVHPVSCGKGLPTGEPLSEVLAGASCWLTGELCSKPSWCFVLRHSLLHPGASCVPRDTQPTRTWPRQLHRSPQNRVGLCDQAQRLPHRPPRKLRGWEKQAETVCSPGPLYTCGGSPPSSCFSLPSAGWQPTVRPGWAGGSGAAYLELSLTCSCS